MQKRLMPTLLTACLLVMGGALPACQAISTSTEALATGPGTVTIQLSAEDIVEAQRRVLATRSEINNLTITAHIPGRSPEFRGFSGSTLSEGKAQATFVGMPLGERITFTVQAFDVQSRLIGTTSKSVTVLQDQATIVRMSLQLQNVELYPGDVFTEVNILDGGLKVVNFNVSTVAGNGTAASVDGQSGGAQLLSPRDVKADNQGNIFLAEAYAIRKVSSVGEVTTFVGSGTAGFADGSGIAARFNDITQIAFDTENNLYVADRGNNRIRKVTPAGVVTTFAGNGVRNTFLRTPEGVTVNTNPQIQAELNDVYIAETGYHCIRRVPQNGLTTTIAGIREANGGFANGYGSDARFNSPTGLAFDRQGRLIIADTGNHRIRLGTIFNGTMHVNTILGDGVSSFEDGPVASASLNGPRHIAVDGMNNLYVSDTGNHRLRKIALEGQIDGTGNISQDARVRSIAGVGAPSYGDGPGNAAGLNGPRGLWVSAGGEITLADGANNRLRLIRQTEVDLPAEGSLTPFSVVANTALTVGRWGHAAVVVGNYLYVVGGVTDSGTYLNLVERAVIRPDGSLGTFSSLSVPTLSTGRHSHTATVLGNHLVVVGGSDATSVLNTIEVAAINSDGTIGNFASYPHLNGARANHSAVVIGPSLYLLGGSSNSIEQIRVNEWGPNSTIVPTTLSTARGGHGTVVSGNNIYVVGGWQTSAERSSINPDGSFQGFISSSEGSLQSNNIGAAHLLGKYLYMVGEQRIERAQLLPTGSLGSFSSVNVPQLAMKRSGAASAVKGNHLYVLGGFVPGEGNVAVPTTTIESATWF